MSARKQRQSGRISLGVPVHVLGTDVSGLQFSEHAKTVVINRDGATVALKAKLAAQQRITIRNTLNDQQVAARIVGIAGGKSGTSIYALALLRKDIDLWNIKFPPSSQASKGVLRLLMECSRCKARETADLTELEAEVFDVNRAISRYCEKCKTSPLWRQAMDEQQTGGSPDLPVSASRTENERKEVRIPLRMRACIRFPAVGEEIVVTDNVSRRGLCFKSRQRYVEGSKVEVSVPFITGAYNIFSAAKILGIREEPSADVKSYRLEYLEED